MVGSAQLRLALHQRGFVVKNSRGRVEKKPRLSVSQKEAEQGLLCLFQALPKMQLQI